jgi:hypothetical protein
VIESIFRKTWVSPLVGIFFVAVGLSGTLMLLHIDLGSLRLMHEWIGLAFVVVSVLHLLANWRALMKRCRTRGALVAMGLGGLLCALFMYAGANSDHGRHGHGRSSGSAERRH